MNTLGLSRSLDGLSLSLDEYTTYIIAVHELGHACKS